MLETHVKARLARMAHRMIDRFDIDLRGFVVLTEAASGPYLPNAVLAALASAERVYAYVKDSMYGKAADIERDTVSLAAFCEANVRLRVVHKLTPEILGDADIVTNSGHLRPLNKPFLAQLKPTAVVPLMWETWEFRGTEVDLSFAAKRGILVLGTREDRPPCDMRPYGVLFATKLLFEMQVPVVSSAILVIGSQLTLAEPIVQGLRMLRANVTWCGDARGADRPLRELRACFTEQCDSLDAVLVAEHAYSGYVIGAGGLMGTEEFANGRKDIPIGVLTGRVDAAGLRRHGLQVYPKGVFDDGRMSYQASELGPQPVMELFAAGLKVGEAMARARRDGRDAASAAKWAMEQSPAMDFLGDKAWVK